MLLTHPNTLKQLVSILEPSISKQTIPDKNLRKHKIDIICEAFWIINNLSTEDAHNIEDRLFNNHNIHQILQAHLLENFIEDIVQTENNELALEP